MSKSWPGKSWSRIEVAEPLLAETLTLLTVVGFSIELAMPSSEGVMRLRVAHWFSALHEKDLQVVVDRSAAWVEFRVVGGDIILKVAIPGPSLGCLPRGARIST